MPTTLAEQQYVMSFLLTHGAEIFQDHMAGPLGSLRNSVPNTTQARDIPLYHIRASHTLPLLLTERSTKPTWSKSGGAPNVFRRFDLANEERSRHPGSHPSQDLRSARDQAGSLVEVMAPQTHEVVGSSRAEVIDIGRLDQIPSINGRKSNLVRFQTFFVPFHDFRPDHSACSQDIEPVGITANRT